jgi:hypothetical protein
MPLNILPCAPYITSLSQGFAKQIMSISPYAVTAATVATFNISLSDEIEDMNICILVLGYRSGGPGSIPGTTQKK